MNFKSLSIRFSHILALLQIAWVFFLFLSCFLQHIHLTSLPASWSARYSIVSSAFFRLNMFMHAAVVAVLILPGSWQLSHICFSLGEALSWLLLMFHCRATCPTAHSTHTSSYTHARTQADAVMQREYIWKCNFQGFCSPQSFSFIGKIVKKL